MKKITIFSFLLSFAFLALAFQRPLSSKGPFFVDTSLVLPFFQPMVEGNRVIEEQDRFLKTQMKQYEDSLAVLMDSVAEHKYLAELELLNLESNVYRHQMITKTSKQAGDILAAAIDSFNLVISEFAQSENIPILFGAQSNFIVYGAGLKADVSTKMQEFVKGKNNE